MPFSVWIDDDEEDEEDEDAVGEMDEVVGVVEMDWLVGEAGEVVVGEVVVVVDGDVGLVVAVGHWVWSISSGVETKSLSSSL